MPNVKENILCIFVVYVFRDLLTTLSLHKLHKNMEHWWNNI